MQLFRNHGQGRGGAPIPRRFEFQGFAPGQGGNFEKTETVEKHNHLKKTVFFLSEKF
jgi:hypothetical protein